MDIATASTQLHRIEVICEHIIVEPCFNEPLYIKVLGITNNIPIPSYSKIYGKEPQYNKLFF